jgi:hypothetical protein
MNIGSKSRGSPAAFFSGKSNVRSSEIETELTRSHNNYGYYFLRAYPITEPYIINSQTEAGKKRLDDQSKIDAAIARHKNLFIDGKQCFYFVLSTNTLASGQFKYAHAKLEVPGGKMYDINFTGTEGVESIPSANLGENGYPWLNSTYGCAEVTPPLQNGYKVRFVTDMAANADPSMLEWSISPAVAPNATAPSN